MAPAPACPCHLFPSLPLSPYTLATLPRQSQTLPSSPGALPLSVFLLLQSFPCVSFSTVVETCGPVSPFCSNETSHLPLATPCLNLALMTHDTCHSLQLPCLFIRLPVFLILLQENVSAKSGLSLFLFRDAVGPWVSWHCAVPPRNLPGELGQDRSK